MEQINAPDAYRTQCVAMITAVEMQEGCFFRPGIGTLLPILEGHLEGYFYCTGPSVRVEHPVEPFRADFDEFFGQFNGGYVGQPKQGTVGNFPQL